MARAGEVVIINPKSTFTTLRYRHRLQGSTPRKEAELTDYVQAQGVSHRAMAQALGIARSTLLSRLDELGLR